MIFILPFVCDIPFPWRLCTRTHAHTHTPHLCVCILRYLPVIWYAFAAFDCILFYCGFPCLGSCATTSLLILGRKKYFPFKDFFFWPLFSSVYSDIPTVVTFVFTLLESTVPLKPVVWHLYSVFISELSFLYINI